MRTIESTLEGRTMGAQQVRDGARLITFEGMQLGHVSSRRSGVPRWTEMTVWITDGGSYVLEKVGRSVVCHMPGCTDVRSGLPRFQEAHPGDDPDNGYEFHEDCVPMEYDFTRLLVEEDRYWARVTKDPQEIYDALERRKGGVRTLPRICSNLLEQVTDHHPDFGDFWRTGSID